MKRAVLRRKLERCVGIQIQTPTGRRPDGARDIEPDQPVDEARAHADADEGPGQRELLARTRASHVGEHHDARGGPAVRQLEPRAPKRVAARRVAAVAAQGSWPAEVPDAATAATRSEEHTSELQSRLHLVCRLLLEKKKNTHNINHREGL